MHMLYLSSFNKGLRQRLVQMKHTGAMFVARSFCLVGLVLTLCSACEKLPRNGKLDGYWQLMERDGQSVREERNFWSVQLDLIQLTTFTSHHITDVPTSGGVVLRFNHRGDSLHLTQGYLMNRDHQQDILIDSVHTADLSAFGIAQLPMHYAVSELSNERMVLTSGSYRLVFRKW